jgi:hypothetical protein
MSLPQAHSDARRRVDRSTDVLGARRETSSGIKAVGWIPPHDHLDHPRWVAVGRRLGGISRNNQWWLGDWLRYGTAKWGEKYVEAAQITGYDVRSLANMATLAACFEISRRRDNLSWSHHAVVAALDPDEQDRWLDLAASERLSVADLRIELRSVERRREAQERTYAQQEGEDASDFICPRCGYRAPRARTGAAGRSVEEAIDD